MADCIHLTKLNPAHLQLSLSLSHSSNFIPPSCSSCSTHSSLRTFICLSCASFSCYSHLNSHPHPLHLDLRSIQLYCSECKDYSSSTSSDHLLSSSQSSYYSPSSSPTPLQPPPPPLPHSKLLTHHSLGFKNLGQTCYLSVVLQSLLHNPFLSLYFLSDGHNRHWCKSNSSSSCTACKIDEIFEAGWKEGEGAVAPTGLLYTVWKEELRKGSGEGKSELAGYAQQDAHEFLISALNLLHTSTLPSPPSHPPPPTCPCPIHQTFSGLLLSLVTCASCKNQTKSLDPFLDLSLEIPKEGGSSLGECLKRFTRREELGVGSYSCGNCGGGGGATKRLGVWGAPKTLLLQLKRFEHTTTLATSTKIDTHVKFPLTLNLKDYSSISSKLPKEYYDYDLLSVACHEGSSLNNGHFITFCRNSREEDFYSFDDEKVRRVSYEEVLRGKAYLLCYVKRNIGFGLPTTTTTAPVVEEIKIDKVDVNIS